MEDKITSRFLHSIDKYAKKKKMKIEEEIKQIESERIRKEESKIVENARMLMMSELADVRSLVSAKIYKAKSEAIHKIYDRCVEIESEVFEECKSKIIEFTQSDKYLERADKSITYASEKLGSSMTVFIRKQDQERFSSLLSSLNKSTSERIKYGGLFFSNGNIVLDDTFDSYLQEQKKWFVKNCIYKFGVLNVQ